jgi:hypothetical protein
LGGVAPRRVDGRLEFADRGSIRRTNKAFELIMKHKIYSIINCKYFPPYSLQLKFDDGLERVVDLENILEGQIYGPLRDEKLFSKVIIDPEIRTLTWPNGADFDPTVLHDWPMHQDAFACAARRWKSSSNLKNTPHAELAESGV